MSLFIETILAENGTPKALSLHQERLNATILDHGGSLGFDLNAAMQNMDIPNDGKYKIRVTYDLLSIHHIEVIPYKIKVCRSFKLVDIRGNDYRYKFADRKWIYTMLDTAGTDEIIMVKDGMITDASIANLAFFDGETWQTPVAPLLKGTRRASLLQEGKIKPALITPDMLSRYSSFKLINAMIDWEESISYSTALIVA